MKVFKIALSSVMIFALASCSSSKDGDQQDSAAVDTQTVDNQQDSAGVNAAVDTLQAAAQDEAQAAAEEVVDHAANTKIIKTVYDKFVFGTAESGEKNYFTANALKKLAQAYEYDCEGGNCYAFNELRSAAEDGPSDIQKVLSIDPAEDGWYVVSYNDMGNKGKTKVKVVDGKIDDYKRVK
jgi:hypothetical protein